LKVDFGKARGPLMAAAREFLEAPLVRKEALEKYRQTGYLILSDLFEPSELAQMRAAWGQIAEQRRQEGKKPHATLLMTHITHPEIAAIVRHPLLIKTVEAVLGGRVDLIQSQLMHGMPGTKGFSPHQDNFYNRANPRDGIVAAWMALEDVDKENGALGVFPASHLNGLADTNRDWVRRAMAAIPPCRWSTANHRTRTRASDGGRHQREQHSGSWVAICLHGSTRIGPCSAGAGNG